MSETKKALQGIIFDHTALLVDRSDGQLLAELGRLLERLRDFGLRVVVFSTHPKDLDRELARRGLPAADRFLTRADVETRWPGRKSGKGSPAWIELAAESLGVEPFQLMYIGDDRQDWLTAINAATFYLHAGWRPYAGGTISYVAHTPLEIIDWITHFLLLPPRWEFSLDDPSRGIFVRSLLSALVDLPGTRPGSTFKLRQVFGDEPRDVRIGENSARDLLMLHALAGLYLEGFIQPNSLFAVYPSHMPGEINDSLRGFLGPVSKLFRGYFKEDLLVRGVPGKDTSLERGRARREGRRAEVVSFFDQTNTVHLNPEYANTIRSKNRTVLVFDDFTTTGRSLDWARNLLLAAGAGRVVLMTVGKYPGPYYIRHTPHAADTIAPYELKTYDESDFVPTTVRMRHDEGVREVISTSFETLRDNHEYPVAPREALRRSRRERT